MRFLALLRKELRESLPWLLLAGLLLLGVGLLALRSEAQFARINYQHWSNRQALGPGEVINAYALVRFPHLAMVAMWLAFIAPGLGLVLACATSGCPCLRGPGRFCCTARRRE